MEKKIIRISDLLLLIPTYFGIITGFGFCVYILLNINTLKGYYLFLGIGILFILTWLILYFISYLRGYKIYLQNNSLTIRYWENGLYPYSQVTIPIWNEKTIYVEDIELIIYAKLDDLKAMIKNEDKYVLEKLKVPKKPVDDTIYVLYIKVKYNSVNIINASPYSKKKIKQMIETIEKINKDITSIVQV